MSDLDSQHQVNEQAAWQELNRQAEWADKRADRDSLRSGLEQATEGLDDPPEKIKLDDEEFDKYRRHGDIRKIWLRPSIRASTMPRSRRSAKKNMPNSI